MAPINKLSCWAWKVLLLKAMLLLLLATVTAWGPGIPAQGSKY